MDIKCLFEVRTDLSIQIIFNRASSTHSNFNERKNFLCELSRKFSKLAYKRSSQLKQFRKSFHRRSVRYPFTLEFTFSKRNSHHIRRLHKLCHSVLTHRGDIVDWASALLGSMHSMPDHIVPPSRKSTIHRDRPRRRRSDQVKPHHPRTYISSSAQPVHWNSHFSFGIFRAIILTKKTRNLRLTKSQFSGNSTRQYWVRWLHRSHLKWGEIEKLNVE